MDAIATLHEAVEAQIAEDKRTGTPDVDECCAEFLVPEISWEVAEVMTEREKAWYIAVCSIVNSLSEDADELVRDLRRRARKNPKS